MPPDEIITLGALTRPLKAAKGTACTLGGTGSGPHSESGGPWCLRLGDIDRWKDQPQGDDARAGSDG